MGFNPAAMFYYLSALKTFDGMTDSEVREVGYEIALIGQNGIKHNDPDSRYFVKSLNKELSGLQALSHMFVAWETIDA